LSTKHKYLYEENRQILPIWRVKLVRWDGFGCGGTMLKSAKKPPKVPVFALILLRFQISAALFGTFGEHLGAQRCFLGRGWLGDQND
jgi:hypothetical protein